MKTEKGRANDTPCTVSKTKNQTWRNPSDQRRTRASKCKSEATSSNEAKPPEVRRRPWPQPRPSHHHAPNAARGGKPSV